MSDSSVSRRDFLETSGKAAFGAMIVPRHVLGGPRHTAPSDQLTIGIVGAGGMGSSNGTELSSERLVAFCDVDFAHAARSIEDRVNEDDEERAAKGRALKTQFESAARYADFREMIAAHPDLDAVVVATPDHTHANVAKMAMEAGKHVYVQKPLTWSIHEARVLTRLAEETGVVTQMGNQGHSGDDGRRVNEIVQSGMLGVIREVHVWTNRPFWPQGIPSPVWPPEVRDPDERGWWPGDFASRVAEGIGGDFTPPESLNWELWRGPVAADIPWHPMYTPFHWRGQVEFGGGALGDMGAHLVDHPYWALELGYPESVEGTSTPWGVDNVAEGDPHVVSFPRSTMVHYRFPRRGVLPPVTMHWYDGGHMPPRHPMLPTDVRLDRGGGVMYVGDRAILNHGTYGRNPRVYPDRVALEVVDVPQRYPRIEESHEMNWVRACKGETEAVSPFSYAGPLTEVMHLGTVALRAGAGIPIEYDPRRGRVVNHDDANRYLTREYRPGWEV